MKVKHFSGYGGCVDVFNKSEKTENTELDFMWYKDVTTMVFRIEGCHEQGLVPYCIEDVWTWFMQRFIDTSLYRCIGVKEIDGDTVRNKDGKDVIHKCGYPLRYSVVEVRFYKK